MESIVARVCGLDVHQSQIVACLLLDEGGKRPKKEIRTFTAMRRDLEALRDWMSEKGVTQVVMEGTGVYWRPVYEVLEHSFDVWLVNARHVKKVPGRKSDVIDAQWLATLLQKGLLRKSFVPSKEIRVLRDLARYRRVLVQTQSTEKNRIVKLIETMGLKLAAVASDVFGVSGLAMLKAIAKGEHDIQVLAQMARSHLRAKMPELRLALECTIGPHHRSMLADQLARLEATGKEIEKYEHMLDEQVKPYEEVIALLCSIHGIKRTAAIEIFAEIGPDLSSFSTPEAFAAWTGTAPGLHESAGRKQKQRRRRGNPYLTSILIECALAATRKKGSYLKEKYRRLCARRPKLVALFAIANKLAHAVFRAVTTSEPYRDLGASYLDQRNRGAVSRKLLNRLLALGVTRDEILSLLPEPPPSIAVSSTA